MDSLRVACATDDGTSFVNRHFGDAEHYDIYDVSSESVRFVKRIDNSTEEEEEEVHADPKKAKGIASILRQESVQVALTKVFGPNIKRIKSKFVCILSGSLEIEQGILKVQQNFPRVLEAWQQGEERYFLDFRKIEVK